MMKNNFRTVFTSFPAPCKIFLSTPILTIGSCFSDSIGALLYKHKFKVLINPFGTVYNPMSIHKLIHYAVTNKLPSYDGYGCLNDIDFHYDFHSSFSALEKNHLKDKIIHAIQSTHQFFQNTRVMLVTYGTAWVYHHIGHDNNVANCHKIPQKNFKKTILTSEEIVISFEKIYNEIKKQNKKIKIILTVSPVRHIKDTLELNAVSKSTLRIACHTLSEKFNDVLYFPSYEIILDDLRDYRFYNEDMIHPSSQAIDYVWQHFKTHYFPHTTQQFLKTWKNITKAMAHTSLHTSSPAHQIFLKNLLHQLTILKKKIDVRVEINSVQKQIIQ